MILLLFLLMLGGVTRWVVLGCPIGVACWSSQFPLKNRTFHFGSDWLLADVSLFWDGTTNRISFRGLPIAVSDEDMNINGKPVVIPAACRRLEFIETNDLVRVLADDAVIHELHR